MTRQQATTFQQPSDVFLARPVVFEESDKHDDERHSKQGASKVVNVFQEISEITRKSAVGIITKVITVSRALNAGPGIVPSS